MTDAFALLAEPRLPWLDTEALKERFRALSNDAHPDRFHGAGETERAAANSRYAELNSAYQTLRESKDRLLHLYQLEAGHPPKDIQRIPPGTMDLFVEIGQICRDCDGHLAQQTGVTSPMLKLKALQAGLDWTEKLLTLQRQVNARRDQLQTELRDLNAVWTSAPPVDSPTRAPALPLERLEQIYRTLSYTTRWTEQLQERLVQLAM